MDQEVMPGIMEARTLLAKELSDWDAEYQDCYDNVQKYSPVVQERMEFYRGVHHKLPKPWQTTTGFPVPDERLSFRTINLSRPTVRSAVAKRLRAFPNPYVAAIIGDPIASLRARKIGQFIQSLFKLSIIPYTTLYNAVSLAEIDGWSWVKTYLDPFSGPRGPDGQPMGKIKCEEFSCLEVFPDPSATRLEDARVIYHKRIMSRAEAEDTWVQDLFGEPPQFRIEGMRLGETSREFARISPRQELVEIIERWERPCRKYPKGRKIVYSGSHILEYHMDAEGNPSLPHRFPWSIITGSNKAFRQLFSDGSLADIIPLNRDINEAASKAHEWMKFAAVPSLLVQDEAEVSSEVDDIGAQIIKVSGSLMKPEFLQRQAVDRSLFEYIQNQRNSLADVSMLSDVARGQPPSSGTSARAIAFQAELNDSAHEPDNRVFQQECLEVIRQAVSLISVLPPGYPLKLMGNNAQVAVELLDPAIFDIDVDMIVVPFSQEPTSRAVKMAERAELFAAQAYEDTPAAQKFRADIGLVIDNDNAQSIYEAFRERALVSQIEFLQTGTLPLINVEDEHDAFLDADRVFMLSDRFRALPPDLQGIYRQYFMMREQIRAGVYATMQPPTGQAPQADNPEAAGPGVESPASGGNSSLPDTLSEAPSVSEVGGEVA